MKALIVIVALASAAQAGGQAEADALFVKGQASYQAGKYQDAIAQFKQAYDLVKDPVYLFNIAQSHRKIGDCTASYEYYNQYLDAAPNAENKDKVNQWLNELKPCVDQRQREQEDAARKAQADVERKQRGESGESDVAPPEQRDQGKPYRVVGIIAGSIGIAGIGVGVGFGLRGSNLKAQIAERCSMPCVWDSAVIQDLHQAGERANLLAWVGYLGGAVALASGIGLYWYGRTRIETVMVAPAPGGATVSAQLRF